MDKLPPSSNLETRWIGRITFGDALALQDSLVQQRLEGAVPDTLLLLEHEPVYTIGRTADQSSLADARGTAIPVFQINRGGQATYHGPGQLVGYGIIDLNQSGRDLHRFLRALEQGLIDSCSAVDIAAQRREGLTGVWIGDRKIASIGVGVRKWITMHGFAINVSEDLTGFDSIVPCGIQGVSMTSVSREAHRSLSVPEFAAFATPYLERALGALRTSH